jgi:CheY-like chemotaxis protein
MSDQAIILLAEDREDDILLVRKAFQKGSVANPLYVVRDGEEAVAYLSGQRYYQNRSEYPLPDLFLLDLKMPRMDGFEVLRWIRQQPTLRTLRVIVLTSSDDIADVNKAYRLGANSFLVKPLDFVNYVGTAELIKEYWLRADRAPQILRPPLSSLSPLAKSPPTTDRGS